MAVLTHGCVLDERQAMISYEVNSLLIFNAIGI